MAAADTEGLAPRFAFHTISLHEVSKRVVNTAPLAPMRWWFAVMPLLITSRAVTPLPISLPCHERFNPLLSASPVAAKLVLRLYEEKPEENQSRLCDHNSRSRQQRPTASPLAIPNQLRSSFPSLNAAISSRY